MSFPSATKRQKKAEIILGGSVADLRAAVSAVDLVDLAAEDRAAVERVVAGDKKRGVV